MKGLPLLSPFAIRPLCLPYIKFKKIMHTVYPLLIVRVVGLAPGFAPITPGRQNGPSDCFIFARSSPIYFHNQKNSPPQWTVFLVRMKGLPPLSSFAFWPLRLPLSATGGGRLWFKSTFIYINKKQHCSSSNPAFCWCG